jgi:ABC-type phosphate transport system substrate-binding protein
MTATELQHATGLAGVAVLASALLSEAAFLPASGAAPLAKSGSTPIRVRGSARMFTLAAGWAEAYHRVKPSVLVDVSGDGPDSPHFAALANGHCDLCVSTRAITKEEADRVKAGTWTKR